MYQYNQNTLNPLLEKVRMKNDAFCFSRVFHSQFGSRFISKSFWWVLDFKLY